MRLQSLLVSARSVDDFLTELVRLAADVLIPPASCGVTMRRDGRELTVASSDARAEQVDEVQYGEGDGPCLEALRSGRPVDVADLTTDPRWPAYRERAVAQGVRCSLSLPLVVDGVTVGALNLYGFDTPGLFQDGQRDRVRTFVLQAEAALSLVLRQDQEHQVSDQLESALASRSTIDRALGIVMGQQRCSAEEAFALLRTQSQTTNTKLRDVAQALITRTTGAPDSAAPFRRQRTGSGRSDERQDG